MNKLQIKLFFFLFLPSSLAAQQFTAIEHVNVVDVVNGKIISNQTVLIRGNIIEKIGKRIFIPAGAIRIKAHDKYLIPGLIDTHVHLAWDLDSLMTIKTWEQLKYLYLPNGITTIREASTRGLEKQTLAASKDTTLIIPGISVAGRVDAQRLKKAGLTAAALSEQLIKSGVHSIKIRYGLTMDDIRAVTKVAKMYGIPVWGHTYYNGDYTLQAIEAGVEGVTHVQGIAQLGNNKRTDAPPADSADWNAVAVYGATKWLFIDTIATNKLINKMVVKGVWLEPTLITEDFVVNDKLLSEVPHIKNSKAYKQVREAFAAPKEKYLDNYKASIEKMKHFVKKFHDAGGIVIAGSDGTPFPGFGIHEELRLLVEAGLSPAEALKAATINAAKVLRLQDDLGTVEKGKKADLVLLLGNPLKNVANTKKISGVMIRGKFLAEKDLKEMMKKVIKIENLSF
jgi:imidazolonepropionase-like amidohydrolase